jgi:hypothetical protein
MLCQNTKREKEHSQNTKIENNEDVHQRVLRAQYSRFHQNVLPEDGPVRPKHVARHGIYILMTF